MRQIRTILMTGIAVAAMSLAGTAEAQGQAQARARRGNPGQAGQAGARPLSVAKDGRADRAGFARGRFEMAGGNTAAMLLRLRTQLSLTDDQVKRLEALRDAKSPTSNEADVLRARADLVEAMQGDGNLAAARTAMDKMNKLRTDRAIAQLKLRQDARAVLTAEQKAKLDQVRKAGSRRQTAMRGMRGMRGMP